MQHGHVAAPADRGQIRGSALRQVLIWLQERLGERRLAEVARRANERSQPIFTVGRPGLGLRASGWYPAAPVHRLCDEIVGEMDREKARRLAQTAAVAAVSLTFTTFHGLLLRNFVTPALHRRFAQRLWRHYFDHGQVEVELSSSCSVLIRIRDWRAHHPFICDITSAADIPIYRGMGLRDVRIEPRECIADGAPLCAHDVVWSS
jgi:hypothetical protein